MLEIPSPESLPKDLQEIYSRRFRGNLDYRNRVWQTLTADFFSRWIRPSDRVLDLGCGYCQFINHIACSEKYGMDLNPSPADHPPKTVILLQHGSSRPPCVPPGNPLPFSSACTFACGPPGYFLASNF